MLVVVFENMLRTLRLPEIGLARVVGYAETRGVGMIFAADGIGGEGEALDLGVLGRIGGGEGLEIVGDFGGIGGLRGVAALSEQGGSAGEAEGDQDRG
jgi:hypothetical protein